jgi:hypothetical protein
MMFTAYPGADPLPGVIVDLLEVAAGRAVPEVVRPTPQRSVDAQQQLVQIDIQGLICSW